MATTFEPFPMKDALARLAVRADQLLDPNATEEALRGRAAALLAQRRDAPEFARWTQQELRTRADQEAANEQQATRTAVANAFASDAADLETSLRAIRTRLERLPSSGALLDHEKVYMTIDQQRLLLEQRMTRATMERLAAILAYRDVPADQQLDALDREYARGAVDAAAWLDETLERTLSTPALDPVERHRQTEQAARLAQIRDARIAKDDREALDGMATELHSITARVQDAVTRERVRDGDVSLSAINDLFESTRRQRADATAAV